MKSKATIERRSIYEHGGRRKRNVYDTRCNEPCDCRESAATRKAALAALAACHKFVNESPSLERNGCRLYAVGFEAWCLEWRRGTPSCTSMMFHAPDWIVAWETCLNTYGTHDDLRAFFYPSAEGD